MRYEILTFTSESEHLSFELPQYSRVVKVFDHRVVAVTVLQDGTVTYRSSITVLVETDLYHLPIEVLPY